MKRFFQVGRLLQLHEFAFNVHEKLSSVFALVLLQHLLQFLSEEI